MFEYIKSNMSIKERADLENALIGNKQTEELAGEAMVDLGELSAGNMDAIVELAAMVASLEERVRMLEDAQSK